MKRCPECNSDKVIVDAVLVNNDGSITRIAVDEQPNALIIKKRNYSEIGAEVCGDCGLIALRAKDAVKLRLAYQNRQNNI